MRARSAGERARIISAAGARCSVSAALRLSLRTKRVETDTARQYLSGLSGEVRFALGDEAFEEGFRRGAEQERRISEQKG